MKMKMRYFLLAFIAVVVCTVSSVNAQVKYGPVGGLNLANLSGDISDNAMKIGFHVGGMVSFGLSDNLSVDPSVLYSTKGTQDSKESKYKTNLNFIEVPIHVRYTLDNGFNFYAGPFVGLLMSAKYTDGNDDIDIKDNLKGLDYGLSAGLGYQMESGLGFGARYALGLANISDVENTTINTGTICVSVNFLLGGD